MDKPVILQRSGSDIDIEGTFKRQGPSKYRHAYREQESMQYSTPKHNGHVTGSNGKNRSSSSEPRNGVTTRDQLNSEIQQFKFRTSSVDNYDLLQHSSPIHSQPRDTQRHFDTYDPRRLRASSADANHLISYNNDISKTFTGDLHTNGILHHRSQQRQQEEQNKYTSATLPVRRYISHKYRNTNGDGSHHDHTSGASCSCSSTTSSSDSASSFSDANEESTTATGDSDHIHNHSHHQHHHSLSHSRNHVSHHHRHNNHHHHNPEHRNSINRQLQLANHPLSLQSQPASYATAPIQTQTVPPVSSSATQSFSADQCPECREEVHQRHHHHHHRGRRHKAAADVAARSSSAHYRSSGHGHEHFSSTCPECNHAGLVPSANVYGHPLLPSTVNGGPGLAGRQVRFNTSTTEDSIPPLTLQEDSSILFDSSGKRSSSHSESTSQYCAECDKSRKQQRHRSRSASSSSHKSVAIIAAPPLPPLLPTQKVSIGTQYEGDEDYSSDSRPRPRASSHHHHHDRYDPSYASPIDRHSNSGQSASATATTSSNRHSQKDIGAIIISSSNNRSSSVSSSGGGNGLESDHQAAGYHALSELDHAIASHDHEHYDDIIDLVDEGYEPPGKLPYIHLNGGFAHEVDSPSSSNAPSSSSKAVVHNNNNRSSSNRHRDGKKLIDSSLSIPSDRRHKEHLQNGGITLADDQDQPASATPSFSNSSYVPSSIHDHDHGDLADPVLKPSPKKKKKKIKKKKRPFDAVKAKDVEKAVNSNVNRERRKNIIKVIILFVIICIIVGVGVGITYYVAAREPKPKGVMYSDFQGGGGGGG